MSEPKEVKVKIVSDGTTWGTKIVDEETGNEIHNVTKIEWTAEAGHMCVARITLVKVPVEITAEVPPEETKLVVKGRPTSEDIKVAQEIQAGLDEAP